MFRDHCRCLACCSSNGNHPEHLEPACLAALTIQKGWVKHWGVTVHTLPVKPPRAPHRTLSKSSTFISLPAFQKPRPVQKLTYSRHLKNVPFCILACVTCRQAGVSCLTKVLSFSFLLNKSTHVHRSSCLTICVKGSNVRDGNNTMASGCGGVELRLRSV